MKIHYLLLVLSLGIPNISYSQKLEQTIKTELPCYNTQELFKILREKYKELPLLTGKADDEVNSTMSLWLNPFDNNWTIIATKNDLSCVVGTGTDIKIIPTRTGTSI
jgi:hypothetical protein